MRDLDRASAASASALAFAAFSPAIRSACEIVSSLFDEALDDSRNELLALVNALTSSSASPRDYVKNMRSFKLS